MINPSEHMIQIKTQNGKQDYLPVQWRLVWFREQCPQGTIETEMLHLDLDRECETEVSVWNDEKRKYEKVTKRGKGIAIFKATVTDGKGGKATGTKQDNAACFDDFIERAETGSIGRALAALGFGTQFCDDLDEGDRLADAPVTRPSRPDVDRPGTTQQIETIMKLQKQLGMEPTSLDGLPFSDLANLLKELSARLSEQRKAS